MQHLKMVWAPQTVPDLQSALAVYRQYPMTYQQYRDALKMKLQTLLEEAGPEEARRAMEMSEEYLPEMAVIARTVPLKAWAQAIMMSDTMDAAIGQIQWSKEGPMSLLAEMELREALQEQTIISLLEYL